MKLNEIEFLNNTKSYALMGMDLKLKNYLNFQDGFYIEAGANDGVRQSNTKIFEELFGWKGILIEPSISAYHECLINRPESIVINCALTDSDDIKSINGDFDGNLMSSIGGIRRGNKYNTIDVLSRTLTSILDEYNINNVDFISLDVEGYELSVLKGFDMNRWKPKYILIEINGDDRTLIEEYLLPFGYINILNVSDFGPHNNPLWDGTHNDYLFELNIL